MTNTGDMLRLARQRRGLTQKAAAERLGIVQPVLSRFENGVSEPDNALLLKAGQIYGLPRAFFDLREPVYGPPVSVHPMARAKADVTARDLDMVTAELNIRAMHLRRFLESVDFQPTASLPSLDIDEYGSAEKIASIVRSHWSIPRGPIKNLMAFVERAGVVVSLSDFGGASISGMTFRIPGQPPLVLLNQMHPGDRLRFTLAHELGHLVMHRFPTPDMETEANQFASAFLMPADEMKDLFRGRRINLELLAALKPEWRVAIQALLMRAKGLGFLDANQNRYLWQQISSRGWRLREPPELDIRCERPTILHSIIRSHVDHFGYTLADFARLVPLYESEFTELYGAIDNGGPEKPRLRLVT